MADFIAWFTVAVILVAAELVTGTFYLLMVALGTTAGGIAALLGAGLPLQCLSGAFIGTLSVVALRRSRWGRRGPQMETGANPDIVIDIGQPVNVPRWNEGAARVRYRGSDWDAVPESTQHPSTGTLIIRAVRGSTLVLGPSHHNE